MSIFNQLHESTKKLTEDAVQGGAQDVEAQPSASVRPQNGTKGFRITYEIVTPESAERGDAAERGWISEDGESMDPDADDLEIIAENVKFQAENPDEQLDPSQYPQSPSEFSVHAAAKYLRDNSGEGGIAWSGGSAGHGWWTSYNYNTDYRTGAEESRSYHPYGFSDAEITEITTLLKRR